MGFRHYETPFSFPGTRGSWSQTCCTSTLLSMNPSRCIPLSRIGPRSRARSYERMVHLGHDTCTEQVTCQCWDKIVANQTSDFFDTNGPYQVMYDSDQHLPGNNLSIARSNWDVVLAMNNLAGALVPRHSEDLRNASCTQSDKNDCLLSKWLLYTGFD